MLMLLLIAYIRCTLEEDNNANLLSTEGDKTDLNNLLGSKVDEDLVEKDIALVSIDESLNKPNEESLPNTKDENEIESEPDAIKQQNDELINEQPIKPLSDENTDSFIYVKEENQSVDEINEIKMKKKLAEEELLEKISEKQMNKTRMRKQEAEKELLESFIENRKLFKNEIKRKSASEEPTGETKRESKGELNNEVNNYQNSVENSKEELNNVDEKKQ